jgi:hypothetical protein
LKVAFIHANESAPATHFGEPPPLKIGAWLETHKHGVIDILLESLEAEKTGLTLCKRLMDLVRDGIVNLTQEETELATQTR